MVYLLVLGVVVYVLGPMLSALLFLVYLAWAGVANLEELNKRLKERANDKQ